MTHKIKAAYGQKHLTNWQQSDLANFSYWRKRLASPVTTRKLIPLTLTPRSNAMAVISLAGLKIEIPLESLTEVLPIIHRPLQVSG